ncbi:MAG: PPC domain-containing protein [Planctomycetaceae bacterium]|nr:PPC domain-containing protein [Planctomycetaceae bacterium]
MRTLTTLLLLLTILTSVAIAQQREPLIGYAYPAGGQRGTTFDVLVGGRQIARAGSVMFSGGGVHAEVIANYGQMYPNDADNRAVLNQVLNDAWKRYQGSDDDSSNSNNSNKSNSNQNAAVKSDMPSSEPDKPVITPEQLVKRYPYLADLSEPTRDSMQVAIYEYFFPRPDRKPKETLAQGVLLRVTIDDNAAIGERELRLNTPQGIAPPIRFFVSDTREVCELEPNDVQFPPDAIAFLERSIPQNWGRRLAALVRSRLDEQAKQASSDNSSSNTADKFYCLPPLELPVVANGQIKGGDVDRFTFHASKGRKVIISMQARELVPFLADAVPGWFQGMITLYGVNGKQLATAASYKFEPDPLITFDVPEDGIYTIEVRDTLFRGRDDFVYRLSIGEFALVNSMFPLGGRVGEPLTADVKGYNLPSAVTTLDTNTNSHTTIRKLTKLNDVNLLRPIRYEVSDLPEMLEPQRDTAARSEPVALKNLPIIINGRILKRDEVDTYSFKGNKGERIVLDVTARKLGSPLDAVIEVVDSNGKVIAKNDDRAGSTGPNIGLETHHADPYLMFTLPDDREYVVRLYDALQHYGDEYAYRLRVSPPRPDYAIYCEPSVINFYGATQPITFTVARQDGFDGTVVVRTDKNSPFVIYGGEIPQGVDKITSTITATGRFDNKPTDIKLLATGWVENKPLNHQVVPAQDYEQAFIYHHLVTSESLIVSLRRGDSSIFRALKTDKEVVLKQNGDAVLNVTIDKTYKQFRPEKGEQKVRFALQNQPAGITLTAAEPTENGWQLKINCAETKQNYGNIIINVAARTDTTKPFTSAGIMKAIGYKIE